MKKPHTYTGAPAKPVSNEDSYMSVSDDVIIIDRSGSESEENAPREGNEK